MVLTSGKIFKRTKKRILRKVCYKRTSEWTDSTSYDHVPWQGSKRLLWTTCLYTSFHLETPLVAHPFTSLDMALHVWPHPTKSRTLRSFFSLVTIPMNTDQFLLEILMIKESCNLIKKSIFQSMILNSAFIQN